MKKSTKVVLGCAAVVAISFAGCKNYDDYRDERADYARKHFEKAVRNNPPVGATLSLKDCLALALENNLDLKVYRLEERVANEMRTSEALGMLPDLIVSDTVTNRNNVPASGSKSIGTGGATFGPSQSQDKFLNYLNVDLALSAIDFGLAFFNTQQANDRMLLREQRTKREAQVLQLDVVRAYFQVAAAQRAIDITKQLLDDCRNRFVLITELARTREIDPFRAFDETRRFVEMEKRLTNYIRSYETACVELRALLGFYPAGTIKVDDSMLDVIPEFAFPDMLTMEQIALLERPEMYEIDMQKHINVIEARKAILMMFPNVRIFIDFTNSSNSFLYHQSWWEIGARAAYNLLKLPQHIAVWRAYDKQVDADEERTFAQAVGVMSQVRIAHANLLSTRERLDIDDRTFNLYKNNLDNAVMENKETTGKLSKLELDHIRLSTAEVQIERYLSLGNYYVSYFRLINTLGLADVSDATIERSKADLAAADARAREVIAEAEKEEAAKDADSDADSDVEEEIIVIEVEEEVTFVPAPVSAPVTVPVLEKSERLMGVAI